ncbi:MAG TPA: GDP-mannose 4,6-dehydratase [Candidatus Magasanikbacteria bacterium]|nr:MAG: GDP-mannose 4,6-dehydratase [Candidatus Magasanikbacteria bacterium RIFOXYC2_FULL_39_8]HAT03335.1 GDP-mannose 4,6-dehydratase [Candidatus Magasanikbacteria bacterium]
MKKALITGITGQDGSYLADFLLEKGYDVHGIIRRSSSFNTDRIDHIYRDPHEKGAKMFLHYGDLTDASNTERILRSVQPDEVYNLGAQSHVRVSFDIPVYTADTVALGTLRLLEAIRNTEIDVKFYQASSSEMFGKVREIPQKETTPFYPRSPYGFSKVFAYWATVNYRESYNMFACNGILFNHESPRRGGTFVTKKIVDGLINIQQGKQDILFLGNLDAKRDWGYAKEYMEAVWLILQQDKPDDFVIATGETHSPREFVEETCSLLDFDLEWTGKGIKERGVDRKTGRTLIEIDEKYFRPAEVDLLIGDGTKAKEILKWEPQVKFKDLVKIMVEDGIQHNKR